MKEPTKTLNDLRKHVEKVRLSPLVRKRIERDLKAVQKRLEMGEYKTSAITENIFDVPEKTRQFYDHLNTYSRIAQTWSRVLSLLPLNNFSELLDLCPGYAPKVEIGLFYLGYQGKVWVLDKEKHSIKELVKFLNLFCPKFKILPYVHDLFTAPRRKFSFVIGNHIIDDLILFHFAKKAKVTTQQLYEKEGEFTRIWKLILSREQENFDEIVNILVRSFKQIVSKNGFLCLAQYRSFMEKMLRLDRSYKFSQRVFRAVIQGLLSQGFTSFNLSELDLRSKKYYFNNNEVVVLIKYVN